MSKYYIKFTKHSYMIYTSHLDMQRLFKRIFKRAGISLAYSQGFNPHPLMSFAQPLSLGYASTGELLEFKTVSDHSEQHILKCLNEVMPEGMEATECVRMKDTEKALASRCYAAEYRILIPVELFLETGRQDEQDAIYSIVEKLNNDVSMYLDQPEIIIEKYSKKKRKYSNIDIKDKLRNIEINMVDDKIIMTTILDAGSTSNLSCDALLASFFDFIDRPLSPEIVEITRLQLFYN